MLSALRWNQCPRCTGFRNHLKENGSVAAIERYGYSILNTFALPETGAPAAELKQAIAGRMREVIAYTQSANIDEIISVLPWSDANLVDEVVAVWMVVRIRAKMAQRKKLAWPLRSSQLLLAVERLVANTMAG